MSGARNVAPALNHIFQGDLMRLFNRMALFSFLLFSSFITAAAQRPADVRSAAAAACPACGVERVERRHIVADVFEYSFKLKVGAGAHDVIGLHRVVRERANGVPFKDSRAVFMVHGDLWGFDEAFMSSTLSGAVARENSIGVYLAQKGVDVWGIDLRWTQVPADTTDFQFMKDWNVSTHVSDVGVAIGVARAVRDATGSGGGKVALLGWSRGGTIAYAYANAEAALPEQARQVDALIPVDIAFKLSPEHEEQRAGACARYAGGQQQLAAGVYHSPLGQGVRTFGLLAATDPSGASPVPGMTGLNNKQAALLVGTATHLLFAPYPPVPFYHLEAGTFDANGLPSGLQFTPEPYLYDVYQSAAPFQSATEQFETDGVICGDSLPYDDNLASVNVPVYYVGAGGGFGEFGLDTLSRLGSTDVSSNVVRLYGPEGRAVDFGHSDLFLADNAKELVWKPLYDWVASH
jgi:pimeloyl-ACP methyl ester carboxylesterase